MRMCVILDQKMHALCVGFDGLFAAKFTHKDCCIRQKYRKGKTNDPTTWNMFLVSGLVYSHKKVMGLLVPRFLPKLS